MNDPSPSTDPAPVNADQRKGSRWGRVVAVLIVGLLVGAATFILIAIGQSF